VVASVVRAHGRLLAIRREADVLVPVELLEGPAALDVHEDERVHLEVEDHVGERASVGREGRRAHLRVHLVVALGR